MLPLNLIAFFLGYLQKARTLFDLADDAWSTFTAIAWSGGGKSSFNRIQSNCVSRAWCGRQMGPRWLPKKGLLKQLLAALYQRFWSWPDLHFPSQPVSVNPWSIFSFKNKRYCLNSELSEYVLEYEMFPLWKLFFTVTSTETKSEAPGYFHSSDLSCSGSRQWRQDI